MTSNVIMFVYLHFCQAALSGTHSFQILHSNLQLLITNFGLSAHDCVMFLVLAETVAETSE